MPRTFRHNKAAADRSGPPLCDHCEDLPARHVVRVYREWANEQLLIVCDECEPTLTHALELHQVEFRVTGMGRSVDRQKHS